MLNIETIILIQLNVQEFLHTHPPKLSYPSYFSYIGGNFTIYVHSHNSKDSIIFPLAETMSRCCSRSFWKTSHQLQSACAVSDTHTTLVIVSVTTAIPSNSKLLHVTPSYSMWLHVTPSHSKLLHVTPS